MGSVEAMKKGSDDRYFGTVSTLKVVRAEIWEGDESSKSQVSKSGDSLNDRNLFIELPFL